MDDDAVGKAVQSCGVFIGTSLLWTKFTHRVFCETHFGKDYKKSMFRADLSTPNLKYLSSKQALADTARFIKAVNLKRNITNPKWIVFGGSYAGMQ